MSITFTIDVFCDICETEWIHGTCTVDKIGNNIAEARRVAKSRGWIRKNGKDICPDCQKEKKNDE